MKNTLLALGIVAIGGAAFAKGERKVDALKELARTWHCEGHNQTKLLDEPVTGTVEVKPDLDGSWYSVRYEQRAKSAPPVKTIGLWGYDLSKQKYVSTSFENTGKSSTATTAGWQNGALVWIGNVSADGTKASRESIVKNGGEEIVLRSEAGDSGSWKLLSEMSCKK